MVNLFLMYILKCLLCPNETPGFFLFFVHEMLCHWSTSDEFGGNDMKAIGDAATFTLKCKM